MQSVTKAAGGESIFVDSFAVAKQLMETNYEAFELLCKTELSYQDVGEDFFVGSSKPVIG